MRIEARVLLVVAALAGLIGLGAPAATAADFKFTGRGWGHGLGMSQWGAKGLAEKGYSASEILKHYYTGTGVVAKTAPSSIRVGLLQERTEIQVKGDGRFDLLDGNMSVRASGQDGETWRIVAGDSDRIEVYKPSGGSPVFTSGLRVTVRFEQHDTILSLPQTGYRYRRGQLEVDRNASTDKVRAVLVLPFEEYLFGLGEMPASWHTEAIEAQAIAGRTYALEKIGRTGQNRAVCNCAVYSTTVDQAYVGVQQEVDRWIDAVEATKGLVVTDDGKPIQALYSSSSGGFTEHNEYVFGGSALPYLRGKCDPGDYGSGNPNANWSETFTGAEVEDRLADAGYRTGPVEDIDFLPPRGVSGRVRSVLDEDSGGVRIEGTLDTVRMSGSTFRSIFELKSNLIFHLIYGAIRSRYDSLMCRPGLPAGGEFTWKDLKGTARGRAQNFVIGRLFWNSTTKKVFWTYGSILRHYDGLRKAGTDLGLPKTDELGVAGGRASYFERGRIYWSSRTSSKAVWGSILAKYLSTGGPAKWGFPTTDEYGFTGGRASRFEKARIYWTPAHGSHIVYGAILAKYIELGGGTGRLGVPISDEYSVSGGRRSDFEKGYLVWNSETKKVTVHYSKSKG